MEKVSKEGVITVKEGRTIDDKIEITDSMHFDRGFITPYVVTDVKTQEREFEKPLVLLSESKTSRLQDSLLWTRCSRGSRLEDTHHVYTYCRYYI
ncbi:uncharacterized protein C8Q71DRAFT_769300 [Rhodofomes roseus]|uniref:Uncharacterized protein n=1 Tax=Rhodofomes roseus TaxID=34475 RepID=A0ABQ8KAU5_9APHY|nr:uncharacterized protein C8Q71DRAFT_769300 [Rhodofomes roseus]KAH9834507.1 hypothetical protein C8Q71DRAFT_769300 [Rhodofomes roseus]